MLHPIETAARDGSRVFLTDGEGTVAKGKWAGDMWAYDLPSDIIEQVDFEPTGWVDDPRDIFNQQVQP